MVIRSLALCLLVGAAPAFAGDPAAVVLPDALDWAPAPPGVPSAAQVAVLDGNPAEAGPFTIRLRFPDKLRVAEHTHPAGERLTVLLGTMYLEMEDADGKSRTYVLPTGSFVEIPEGRVHSVRAEGLMVFQLESTGPFGMSYVHPEDDPRNRT